MASKKQNSRRVLKGLIDYLILSLNELKDVQRKTLFAENVLNISVGGQAIKNTALKILNANFRLSNKKTDRQQVG